jgi:hypothetical protein
MLIALAASGKHLSPSGSAIPELKKCAIQLGKQALLCKSRFSTSASANRKSRNDCPGFFSDFSF